MTKILELIEDVKKSYEETPLKVNPSFAPTMPEVYDLIDLYWSSRYRDGDLDSLGYKKVFYNIVKLPVYIASKMLDIDLKDINLITENGADYWTAWLMSKEFKHWAKERYWGKDLNRYAFLAAKYGSLWVKKVNDDVLIVPPQNMIFNPIAVDYRKIPLVEKHIYSAEELANTDWDNVNEVIDGNSSDKITIYEAWFPNGYLQEKENYFIIDKETGKILFYDTKENCPYKLFNFEDLPGRVVGSGRVEELFEDQIYLNRIANYKAEGFHWTSKHIYQTRDTNVGKNLLTEVDNGEILLINSEITPVANEERNLQAYSYDEARWENNAYKRVFSKEPISGERMPSGVPLGSTIIQSQMAGGFYKQKKEELAMFIKEILWDWVFPVFKNEKRKEHKVLIKNLLSAEDNSDKFFNLLLSNRMMTLRAKESKYLSEDQWRLRKAIQAEILKNSSIKIPKGLYDDIEYKIDIVITGEEIDISSRQATLNVVFQVLGANPQILQDKRAKKVFYKMLDFAGINPYEIFNEDVESIEDISAPRAGSVAAPRIPQVPVENNQKQMTL